jgi:hypothetical protein
MSSMDDDLIPCDRCGLQPATWASGSPEYPTGYDSAYAPEQNVCSGCLPDEERADFLLWGVERQAQREGLAVTDGEA